MIASIKQASEGHTLLTIGYEGLDVPRFIKFLTCHHVKMLVDVRELPFSRKKGFSKTPLSAAVEGAGMRYTHVKALGSPADIRKKVKTDGDYAAFFKAYDAYLETQDEALSTLGGMLEEYRRVCLMCFEANPAECHRSNIARHMAREFGNHVTVEPVQTWVK
ncbi:MAG: DUF488 domain-containing protein [bacterium]